MFIFSLEKHYNEWKLRQKEQRGVRVVAIGSRGRESGKGRKKDEDDDDQVEQEEWEGEQEESGGRAGEDEE